MRIRESYCMNIKRKLLSVTFIIFGMYLALCVLVYFAQEKIIFHPQVLDNTYNFESTVVFEEINLPVDKDVAINFLVFKSPTPSKGLIFYLHGYAGCL